MRLKLICLLVSPLSRLLGFPIPLSMNAENEYVRLYKNSGCLFPFKRITVNLAPADPRKEGSSNVLPIAIGVLLASEQIASDDRIGESLFLGELSLDGSLRHTNGSLPMVALAAEKQVTTVFVPAADEMEASYPRS